MPANPKLLSCTVSTAADRRHRRSLVCRTGNQTNSRVLLPYQDPISPKLGHAADPSDRQVAYRTSTCPHQAVSISINLL
jgi:hypothetical protein